MASPDEFPTIHAHGTLIIRDADICSVETNGGVTWEGTLVEFPDWMGRIAVSWGLHGERGEAAFLVHWASLIADTV